MNVWDAGETFAEMIHFTTERLGTAVMQAENHLSGRVLDAFCESHETTTLILLSQVSASGHKRVPEAKKSAELQEVHLDAIPEYQLLQNLLPSFAVHQWPIKCHHCRQHQLKRMLPQLKKQSRPSQL